MEQKLAEDQMKIKQLLDHLSQSEEGRRVAGNLIDQFRVIEDKFQNLNANEKEIFNNEYTGKLHKALDSLDKAVHESAFENSVNESNLLALFFIVFVCG